MLTCEPLSKDYEQWETKLSASDKMRELITWVRKPDNQIPVRKSSDTFTDGTKMGHFWINCKTEGWRERHPDAYQLIQICEPLRVSYVQWETRR